MANEMEQKNKQNMEQVNQPSPFMQIIKAICYLASLVVMQNAVSMVLISIWSVQLAREHAASGISMTTPEVTVYMQQKVADNTNLIVALYTPFLILFLAVFFALRRKNLLKEAGFRKFSKSYLPAILLISVGLILATNMGLTILPSEWRQSYSASSERLLKKSDLLLVILSNVISAPLSEEMIMRGLVYSRLKKAFPVWFSVLASGLIFGALHGQILWVIYTAFLGIILALVAEHTGSTTVTLIIHVLFNLYGSVAAFLGLQMTYLAVYVGLFLGILLLTGGMYLLYRQPKNA